MSVDFDATRRRLIGAATLTALLSVTRLGHAAGGARQIIAVRVWPSSTYTRITLESPEPLHFKQFTMKNPERLVVGHPFNPPHLIPLVEITKGEKTADEAV